MIEIPIKYWYVISMSSPWHEGGIIHTQVNTDTMTISLVIWDFSYHIHLNDVESKTTVKYPYVGGIKNVNSLVY